MATYIINEESIAKVKAQIERDGFFDVDAFLAALGDDEELGRELEETWKEEPDEDTLQMIERWESDTWS